MVMRVGIKGVDGMGDGWSGDGWIGTEGIEGEGKNERAREVISMTGVFITWESRIGIGHDTPTYTTWEARLSEPDFGLKIWWTLASANISF